MIARQKKVTNVLAFTSPVKPALKHTPKPVAKTLDEIETEFFRKLIRIDVTAEMYSRMTEILETGEPSL